MITSNQFPSALADLSSFEPEAILAAVPGEHPRAAAALAVGREASRTGALDVAELSRIANELYAEGFPAGSPLAKKDDFPSNDSLSHVASGSVLPGANTLKDPVQTPTPSIVPAVPVAIASAPDFAATEIANTGYVNHLPISGVADIAQLLAGVDDPYQAELKQLLGGLSNGQAGIQSSGSDLANTVPYYFLQDSTLNHKEPNQVPSVAHPPFDANLVRKDFPILRELVNGRPLIWFDNAATTQKPQAVIDRISYFYEHENSNIHRAAH